MLWVDEMEFNTHSFLFIFLKQSIYSIFFETIFEIWIAPGKK